MRTQLLILILCFAFQSAVGQDIVTLKNDQQLNIKVTEQTNKYIKYKMSDYEDGPILLIKNNRIFKIEYKNGFTDQMGFQNPRKYRPLGASSGYVRWVSEAGGMISTTIDYFIIPQINIEFNYGTDGSYGYYFSGGSRIHFNNKYSGKKLTPFTGLLVGAEFDEGFIQVPVGVNYVTPMGLNASFSVNEMFFLNSWTSTFLELRVGWRFKI